MRYNAATMAIEQTLILIKPDGAFRKLTGLTIDRLDATGLEMVGAKMLCVSEKLAREHYASLSDKPFFEGLTHSSADPADAAREVALCSKKEELVPKKDDDRRASPHGGPRGRRRPARSRADAARHGAGIQGRRRLGPARGLAEGRRGQAH